MIHKTSVIDPKAEIASNVEIGPYCVIGPKVKIDKNTIIKSHVNISGNVVIGKGNKIYPFVSINEPQDLKYKGENTNLIIGDNNKIREYVTINPGTEGGGGKTIIGKSLSKSIDYKFYDLDNFIEVGENKKISEIFNDHNEVYFRMLENRYLKKTPMICGLYQIKLQP